MALLLGFTSVGHYAPSIVMLPFYLLFLHNGLLSLNAFYPKKQAE